MFAAVLIMSRLEKKIIRAHLNQDIKLPFATLKLSQSSPDLCPQMAMWQMIFPKDIQDTKIYSGPMQEATVGSHLGEVQIAPTYRLEGIKGEAMQLTGPLWRSHFHELCCHFCYNKAQYCLPLGTRKNEGIFLGVQKFPPN